ncbi:glutamine-hydrolyzing carbamoyl-phosphate synthase small subunit [Auritidibacter ignavus]|uniref:glutamine-hydrolyzing carbamoyl-phosphate synthase small subunit n=1 Tax=Auritidibacter ignavus TaxID=678932 RepID=UPI00244B5813|nr:glutamine-hydrolyzing carbamoyl-phosphate synthase small subunit [Auritidibacter ignavus]WGH86816.1 glutamine-hydrolyzing carbamoyl-phosphate synthase small subunit [Auritidibacter ignavus]WGH89101.1 glutamine-hydrolyzing carbamoyl-phosphate synthase small subunit [Auritidibacter ignavus]
MSLTDTAPAVLVLEDGTTFTGRSYGAVGTTLGEAIFTTGMTGYQEVLTDPSCTRQIVVHSSPHIGNTGANDEDFESERYWCAGLVVREPSRVVSSWRATRSLEDDLVANDIVGIQGVDTRALVRRLRTVGVMNAGIFSGESAHAPWEQLISQVTDQPSMKGLSLIDGVTTEKAYSVGPADYGYDNIEETYRVAVLDLGVKAATLRQLAMRGIRLEVLPANTSLQTIVELNPDGVFYSNGPGDPATADEQIATLRKLLTKRIPFFGICFGHQLFGRALGFDTYKLPFGHRGPNQPVMEEATGKTLITTQNHGFAVDAPRGQAQTAPRSEYGAVKVSYYSLNDQVVEGLTATDLPAFSVQFHPEAAAGPHDSHPLFDHFTELMDAYRATR